MSRTKRSYGVAAAALVTALAAGAPAHAYNMEQGSSAGFTQTLQPVACTARDGFAHWNTYNISWYLNTAGQGAGKQTAIQQALATWSAAGTYSLQYAGTWGGGFMQNDGHNTISWGTDGVCDAHSCHAITALLLQAPSATPNGQVILEADILFNANTDRNFQWMTDGQYSPNCWQTPGSSGLMIDTQGIATHELGHSLGLHHPDTQDTSSAAPTMGLIACTTDGRTLATDDVNGLQCSENRYPYNPSYDGSFDAATCATISGWAWNANRSSFPSYVEVVDNPASGPRVIAAVAANGAANSGHGFTYNTGPYDNLFDAQWHSISVRHTGTAVELPGSRKSIICGLELFPQTMNPADPYLSTNGLQYEVGTQFQSSTGGSISDLGYYFAPTESDAGTHTIKLWADSNPNMPLATATIAGPIIPGRIGWSYARLSSPVQIQAGVKYRVSVNTYANQSKSSCGSANSLQSPYVSSPLTALQGFWAPGNGVFPNTASCSNFFVSVRFQS